MHTHEDGDVSDCEYYTWWRVSKAVVPFLWVGTLHHPFVPSHYRLISSLSGHQGLMPERMDWNGVECGAVECNDLCLAAVRPAWLADYSLSTICNRISPFLYFQQLCWYGHEMGGSIPSLSSTFNPFYPFYPFIHPFVVHCSFSLPWMIPLSLLIWLSAQSPSLIPRTPPPRLSSTLSLPYARTTNTKISSRVHFFHHITNLRKTKGWDGPLRKAIIVSLSMLQIACTVFVRPWLLTKKKKGGEGRQSSRDREIKKRRLIDRERGGQY